MENFIEALESDVIRSRAKRTVNSQVIRSNAKYSPHYKHDIKKSIKKFYKWLWGNSRSYPAIVEWIDTYLEPKEVPALRHHEVERIVDTCITIKQRAIVQTLYDGGFRISEFLNLRLHHLRLQQFIPNDPSKRCFFARVVFSKTSRRTVALPMHESTKWLSRWLEEHPARPIIQPDGSIQSDDNMAQLFPVSDNAIRLFLKRFGQLALNKRVYPHLLRHSSATYWANKLPYFKFCKRFGWTMTSKMPQRYIDREGVDEIEVAVIYHRNEQTKLARDNEQLSNQLAELKARSRDA